MTTKRQIWRQLLSLSLSISGTRYERVSGIARILNYIEDITCDS